MACRRRGDRRHGNSRAVTLVICVQRLSSGSFAAVGDKSRGQPEGLDSPEAWQRVGVAILGMHRSGTSAVAGFLAKAGFFAGEEDDLLPAAEDNPKGFFERADVNALNDDLLANGSVATGTGHLGAPSWRNARRRGGPRSTRCWAPLRPRPLAARWC